VAVVSSVTCLSPRQFGKARSLFAGAVLVALMALLVAMIFGLFDADTGWGIAYTVFTAVLAATASRLPYTFYRDRPV
jgi:hypothetical protein